MVMGLFSSSNKMEDGENLLQEKLLAGEEERTYQDHNLSESTVWPGVWRSIWYTSFALFNISLGILLGYWCRAKSDTPGKGLGMISASPIPQDIFTARYDIPFVADERYIGPSKEVEANWAALTRGSDSIYVSQPQDYGLNDPGIRAPFFLFNEPPSSAESLDNLDNFYVLSNMHQLHCTNMIRKRYNMLVYQADSTDALSGRPIDADWITHLEHCFEYLRLSITCADYMVLESDSPPGSPEEYWKDGLSWGVVHSCVHWDHLMDYQEKQVAIYNSTWSS